MLAVCLRGNCIVFPAGIYLAAVNYREIMRRRFMQWRELVCLQQRSNLMEIAIHQRQSRPRVGFFYSHRC